MQKNDGFLSRPPIGTRCLYDPSRMDDSFNIYGKYFVEITKYISDMPVCKILEVIEPAGYGINTHTVGKEVFFISVVHFGPNDIFKEIL